MGKEAAQRIHDEGITLDEYYAFYIERETKERELSETMENRPRRP